ncbi:hybrid sensor histidine kinase/response regulator [Stigmatella aurantiaca]|uniref:histidine kinase n=1 Tax=Stigmatella aurantiaca (strain DW4/3-1) TaxID=378806 RepID=Q08SP8_STIAD|nr:hybrid sensor histidine kinase/response regulator [Stigmatella aurantiaca]ADO71280.1 Sensor protein [Stigmatella aurantiaca DW4/3-1]EAU63513.1 response regulator/sensor histidine kinase [Stigmatella aurantiaca DW4/3-1]
MTTSGNNEARTEPKAIVLNVNDHAATRYLVSRMLDLAGYQVLEASSGQEALVLATQLPDLVLLDVEMPDIDGYEVCRRLRGSEETQGLLIAHLSAVSITREDRIRGLAYGADAYWTTPFEEEELLANIEALLRLQRRAQDAIRVRDDFLSVAAHELKTPLTALRLHLERTFFLTTRTKTDTVPKASLDKGLSASLRQLSRLQQLLDTLLDVSRVSNRRLKLEVGTVDLADVAREVHQRLEPAARALDTEIQLELPAGPLVLFGDRLRMEQVLNNLLTNALKYGNGKPVLLRVEAREDMAVICVKDQGIGIAVQDQARIFERFERATPTQQSGSLGLGLYIAREIVSAHGGTIAVDSQSGHGATFQVLLPLRRLERY